MKSPRPPAPAGAPLALSLCLFALAFATPAAAGGDKDWKPVDPAQLAMTAPAVEKDADAEALFWEVHVTYEDSGGEPATVLNHYVRIKIFNDRGREAQSKVDIPAFKVRGREYKIKDIAARTIKPDGTVGELKPEDVFERDVIKANGLKVKAKSFAMPGVEPGAIIEYRWREVRDGIRSHERFEFSRDIPVQSVKYWIKPYKEALVNDEGKLVGLRAQAFHTGAANFVKENDEVRKASAEAVGDAQAPDEKLQRLFDFVRAKVKRYTDDASGLTVEQLKKIKENKSPSDTPKRGVGTGADIDLLFGAMASAAGFDVR